MVKTLDFLAVIGIIGDFFRDDVLCALKRFFDRVYALFFADILTDGELISKIESNITDEADYIYDAANKTVSAGLVDTHVHMRVHPSDLFSIQAEMSCFPFGVTAAADAGRSEGDKAILDSFMLKNVIFVPAELRNNKAL